MKKKEIIELLISKGRTREEIAKLGIKLLRKMLDEEVVGEGSIESLKNILPQQSEDDILLDIENIKNEASESDKSLLPTKSTNKRKLEEAVKVMTKDPLYGEQKDPPSPSSPLWTQYVLSQFQDDELDGECPRVEGLRRVADELLNGILEEGCDLIMSPSPDNGFVACAKAWVVFGNGKRFEALADASPNNCSSEFAIFPVAMADTRAKGRVYRAALMLKKIIAAEEKCDINNIINRDENIRTGQISAIRILSERLKINPLELINKLFNEKKYADVKMLNFNEAQEVIKELNKLRNEIK